MTYPDCQSLSRFHKNDFARARLEQVTSRHKLGEWGPQASLSLGKEQVHRLQRPYQNTAFSRIDGHARLFFGLSLRRPSIRECPSNFQKPIRKNSSYGLG